MGPLARWYMVHILRRLIRGQVSGSSLRASPFGLTVVTYIYIFNYVFLCYFGDGSIYWLVSRFGGVLPDLADPPNPIFFQNFGHGLSLGICPLPHGSHLLDHVNQCTVSLLHHHTDATSTAMSLYILPCGEILMVHGMAQKCQIWVIRGSLWCCHITMLMSS
jgi:hypothetical protein